jgi:hypothetical protein
MDKHVPGLAADGVRARLRAASAAGIGVHVNLIAGFPGETLDELLETVGFVGDTLADLANVAMVSNTIDDFPEPETPVKIVIRRFGIRSEMSLRLFSRAPRISMYSVTASLVSRVVSVEAGSADGSLNERGDRCLVSSGQSRQRP